MLQAGRTGKVLYLFDIDGTLLRCGGAGGVAFEAALHAHFGIDVASVAVTYGGKTDPQILDEFLVGSRGDPATPAERHAFLDDYLTRLDAALAERGLRVLPHAVEVLEWLGARGDSVLCVATGNVRRGAAIKLRHAALHDYFDLPLLGGYGCDSAVRAELVGAAITRGRQRATITDVVVIGDTIHDISAARANSAHALAVTTGSDTRDALAHADHVFDGLDALPGWHAATFDARSAP